MLDKMKLIKLEEYYISDKKITILVDAKTRGAVFAMAVWSSK